MPRIKSVKQVGKAILVGAGPGDLQLLTLRARAAIGQAEVLIYDFLANERLLQWAPNAKAIYVGKREGEHTLSQEMINALLVNEVKKGNRVVRLKGGDPFLFGRGGEEGRALHEAGLPFEVVPGITSALSVPAYAGIPVTERNSAATLAIVTGHEHAEKAGRSVNYAALSKMGTVVFLMGMKRLRENFAALRKAGVPASRPAAAIQWGTTPAQRTVVGTVGNLADKVKEAGLGAPAVVVVGEVVKLRSSLNWFESKPWFGRRIVVTRSREAAQSFVDEIEHRGALVEEVPTIAFSDPASFQSVDRAIGGLGRFDWIVFTSANGVDFFWKRLLEKNKDARAFAGAKIAVVGPATARALERYGLRADLMPAEFQASRLAQALGRRRLKDAKILLVRAVEGNADFPAAAQAAGASVTLASAYQNVSAKRPAGFKAVDGAGRNPDLVVFASPSAVNSYWGMLTAGEKGSAIDSPVACIGPVTAAAALKKGFSVAVTPKQNTLPSLIEAIEMYFEEIAHGRP